jgi:ribosomal protein S18 acetylase RimI-like enzyme
MAAFGLSVRPEVLIALCSLGRKAEAGVFSCPCWKAFPRDIFRAFAPMENPISSMLLAERSERNIMGDYERNSIDRRRSFSVREMEIDDLAVVFKMGVEVFKAELWPTLYRSWDEYEVTSMFNTDGDYCLVAENDDPDDSPRIMGFVLGTVITKPGSAWSYGYIKWLCAHPYWQREGVSGRLVDKLIGLMIEKDGIRIMMADTDPENIAAVNFFRKKGFSDMADHLYLFNNLERTEQYQPLIEASRNVDKEKEERGVPSSRRRKRKKKPRTSS